MMIKLTGGWISVAHVQAIEPSGDSSVVILIDGRVSVKESPDEVAGRINEIRAVIAVLRELFSEGDHIEAAALLRSLVAKHSEEEGADNGEEESEG